MVSHWTSLFHSFLIETSQSSDLIKSERLKEPLGRSLAILRENSTSPVQQRMAETVGNLIIEAAGWQKIGSMLVSYIENMGNPPFNTQNILEELWKQLILPVLKVPAGSSPEATAQVCRRVECLSNLCEEFKQETGLALRRGSQPNNEVSQSLGPEHLHLSHNQPIMQIFDNPPSRNFLSDCGSRASNWTSTIGIRSTSGSS